MAQQYGGSGTPDCPGDSYQSPANEQLKEAAGEAKRAAGEVAEQAQQTAGKMVEGAKEQATSQLSTQKERAAERLGAVALALRQTGQGLREQDQGAVGRYADTVADQVERLTNYLREKDVSEVMEDVENVARRQPGLFLGSAVALGFLGTRFLMSSGSRAERRQRALSASSSARFAPSSPQRAESLRPDGDGATMGASAAMGTTTRYGTAGTAGDAGTARAGTMSAAGPGMPASPGTPAPPVGRERA
jgi:hypothetical protein